MEQLKYGEKGWHASRTGALFVGRYGSASERPRPEEDPLTVPQALYAATMRSMPGSPRFDRCMQIDEVGEVQKVVIDLVWPSQVFAWWSDKLQR